LEIVNAYAAQHPGQPSAQSIRSVAIHLAVLHGLVIRGVAPGNVMWLRRRVLREQPGSRRDRFEWLDPPDFAGSITVAGIAAGPTPQARMVRAQEYIRNVLDLWAARYGAIVASWYVRFVVPDQVDCLDRDRQTPCHGR